MDASLRQVGSGGTGTAAGLGEARPGGGGRIGSRGETGIGAACPGPGASPAPWDLRSPRAAPRPRCPLAEAVPVALSLERWDAGGFVPERTPARRGTAQPVRGVEGAAGTGARAMCGAGDADRGLLREERVCRMIVMAAQSRLLNPLERLQGPEPAPACVCVSQSGWAPGHRAGAQAGSVRRESPAPRRRCPVTVAPAGRACPGPEPYLLAAGCGAACPPCPPGVSTRPCGHCAATGSE